MSGFVPTARPSSGINHTTKQHRMLAHDAVPMSIAFSFRNGFSFPIILVCKNGLKYRIPGDTNYAKINQDFCVDVIYSFNHGVKIDDESLLDVIGENSCPELKVIKQAVRETESRMGHGKQFVVTHHVNVGDFMRAGKNMNIEELDIVIAAEEFGSKVVHPHSQAAEIMLSTSLSDQQSFFYQIVINDPDKHYGERFVNIAGKIHRCKVSTCTNKSPGVYLYANYAVDKEHQNGSVFSEFYSFKDADEKLALFRTVDEAITLGNLLAAKEREHQLLVQNLKQANLTMKHELDEAKAKLELQVINSKADADQRNAEYQKALSDLKQRELAFDDHKREREATWAKEKAALEADLARQKHEFEQRSLRSKDLYDERSYARKDSSEWLKYVMGLGLLVYAIKK